MKFDLPVRVIGPATPKRSYSGYHVVNTCSNSADMRGLSPFLLGPVELYDGHVSQTMENAWQYSKVYKEFTSYDQPTAAYWEWAVEGWGNPRAVRYPMGKSAKPLYSLWDGRKLGYVAARMQIYLPLYRDAVRETISWVGLKKIYEQHGRVALFDYDGYDHDALGQSLQHVLYNPRRKMGHAFILKMMLFYGERFSAVDVR